MLIADQSFILIYFDIASSYGWGSTASRLVPLWWVSLLFTTKFPAIPSICSFYQPQKDERLSWPWNHPVVLNMQPLDWKSTTLTTRPFLHNYKITKIIQSTQKKALCTGELLRVCKIFIERPAIVPTSDVFRVFWADQHIYQKFVPLDALKINSLSLSILTCLCKTFSKILKFTLWNTLQYSNIQIYFHIQIKNVYGYKFVKAVKWSDLKRFSK